MASAIAKAWPDNMLGKHASGNELMNIWPCAEACDIGRRRNFTDQLRHDGGDGGTLLDDACRRPARRVDGSIRLKASSCRDLQMLDVSVEAKSSRH